jgi:hypothetical protein
MNIFQHWYYKRKMKLLLKKINDQRTRDDRMFLEFDERTTILYRWRHLTSSHVRHKKIDCLMHGSSPRNRMNKYDYDDFIRLLKSKLL